MGLLLAGALGDCSCGLVRPGHRRTAAPVQPSPSHLLVRVAGQQAQAEHVHVLSRKGPRALVSGWCKRSRDIVRVRALALRKGATVR